MRILGLVLLGTLLLGCNGCRNKPDPLEECEMEAACRSEGDCPEENAFCNTQTCECQAEACPQAQPECTTHGDCGPSAYCLFAICECTESECPDDARCREDSECPTGSMCDQEACDCVPRCEFEAACQNDADCQRKHPSAYCDFEECQCVASACADQECDAHDDCPSGEYCDFESCSCTDGEECASPDPEDLGLEEDGDASLDVQCVETAVTTEGARWVRVTFYGPWFPDGVLYSWFLEVAALEEGGTLGAYTRQRHDGVDDTFTQGTLTVDQVSFTQEPNGALLVFDPSLTSQIDAFEVTSGMMLRPDSTFHSENVRVDPASDEVADP